MNSDPAVSDRPRHAWRSTGAFAAILAFFFVSGLCGLLYQVVWTRKLVLLFGTTSYAVSTVLSIFFLGLGLGSLWGGRLADRSKRTLFLYGLFEILIGVWALLFIFFIDAGESAVVAALRAMPDSRPLAIVLRGALVAFFLLLPVTLMGATLPLVVKFATRNGTHRGPRIGMLYSLNTFGAVLGCALAGFVFIPALGYTRSTVIGAVLNIAIGVAALAFDRFLKAGPHPSADEEIVGQQADAASIPSTASRVIVAAFAVSGFCALALEVLWTRLLTFVFLGTTYAFTTMLTTVLCGIAAGSAVAAFLPVRVHRVALFGIVQCLTGLACLAMLFLFPSLPDTFIQWRAEAKFEWQRVVQTKFILSFSVLFLPTALFGMSFPLAVKAFAQSRARLGKDIGVLYSANTFGGVLGALAGGFLLIPLLGVHNSIVVLAFSMCAMGILLTQTCPTFPRSMKHTLSASATVAAIAIALLLPADVSLAMNQWFVPGGHRMIHYSEGVEGTVVVTEAIEDAHGSNRVLWINGVQATASIEKGVKMNRFQGVLPLFFGRELNQALFMCFGSGITAGTLGLSDFERIDAVEISRNVLESARFFEVDNFGVLDNPRMNFIVDDGRNYLLTTDRQYDLISFEPMPLALAGVSTFYTSEYYALCKKRLAPEGLVSQWVPLHNGLDVEVVQSLVGTFVEAFPECTAWFINADLFLIGSTTPQKIDPRLLRERLRANPDLYDALSRVYLGDIPELLASFFMGRENLVRFVDGAPTMTDDKPWAEFLAPKVIHQRNVPELLTLLEPLRQSPLTLIDAPEAGREPFLVEAIAKRHDAHVQDFAGLKVYYRGGLGTTPEEDFRKSLEIDPDDMNAKYYLSEILLGRGTLKTDWAEFDEAVALLLEARGYTPNRLDVALALADAYHEGDREAEAKEAYRAYLDLGGSAVRATERSEK